MSAPSPTVNRIALPPSVKAMLSKVRLRLRRDALATGVLITVCFAVIVFWVTTTLDISWFRLQRLELPVGLRAILLAALLPTTLWIIATRVLFPLIRRIRDTDLALLLERKFPPVSGPAHYVRRIFARSSPGRAAVSSDARAIDPGSRTTCYVPLRPMMSSMPQD